MFVPEKVLYQAIMMIVYNKEAAKENKCRLKLDIQLY
jgi:hypothetical protein